MQTSSGWTTCRRAPRPLAARRRRRCPEAAAVRERCAALLDQVLESLDHEPDESDDALWAYRLAVLHEDRVAEDFAVLAQTLGFAAGADGGAVAVPTARPPLVLPATTWRLGDSGPGFVADIDGGDEPVASRVSRSTRSR
jgi:hypothetical protein